MAQARLRLPEPASLASRLAALAPAERADVLRGMSDRHALELLHDWDFWARPSQRPPDGDWFIWFILTGRGWGKTRVGSEFVRRRAAMYPLGAIVGRTVEDVRDAMVEGPTGIRETAPPWFRPEWERTLRMLTFPNGAKVKAYSAEEPAQLRNKQHYYAWGDEFAEWKYDETWTNLQIGIRLGPDPRVLLTATPKPSPPVLELIGQHERHDPNVALTGGTTFENLENLSPMYAERVISRFLGTRLEAQELRGLLIRDNPDAPLRRETIETHRVWSLPEGGLKDLIVAVDPAGSRGEANAETGIVVGGKFKDALGRWHAVVLEDASLHGSPKEWAEQAISALNRHRGDRIVGERNYGGDMVEATLRGVDDRVRYKDVNATRGKARRIDPVAALYDQGLVHHLGRLAALEDQWCQIAKEDEQALQDRRDACVWLVTELLLGGEAHYGRQYGVS